MIQTWDKTVTSHRPGKLAEKHMKSNTETFRLAQADACLASRQASHEQPNLPVDELTCKKPMQQINFNIQSTNLANIFSLI